jgi:ATP-binding cassette subfamily B protein
MTFIMSMLTLSIYWLGAGLINHSAMSGKLPLFSDMVVFSSYAMQVIMAFMMLTMAFIMLPRASVAAKRIMEVLNTPVTIIDGTVTDSSADGRIEFKNVSFGYPDAEENVLNHITFTAEQGETVAVIGATGSGKSTLINLIPRFYDTTEREVLVDGIDVRDYVQSALRNKIGYISQKAVMFSGTVSSNVSFGDNGSDRGGDVERSIETAQAMDFVKETGIDGHVSQGGSNLSGGQKQRLSIARAICRDPEILIFDDSFSALDYATDRALRDALSERAAKATKVIVAQRISTIRDADMILVLEDGAVVGQGTHDELMKTCDVYKEIALSQLSKEELENE